MGVLGVRLIMGVLGVRLVMGVLGQTETLRSTEGEHAGVIVYEYMILAMMGEHGYCLAWILAMMGEHGYCFAWIL